MCMCEGDEGAQSAFISHWFTQSQSPPNISSVLHLQSPIHWGHEPLLMARITAWWPPRSNEIQGGGKWETGQAGRRRWRRRKKWRTKRGDNGGVYGMGMRVDRAFSVYHYGAWKGGNQIDKNISEMDGEREIEMRAECEERQKKTERYRKDIAFL